MTRKHQSPEYKRNARSIRVQAQAQLMRGNPVPCWRCGHAIMPGVPFDVGHVDPHARPTLTNLAPEHRHATAQCPGNRPTGGKAGADITNRRHINTGVTSWPL